MEPTSIDDGLTLAALGILAFALADVSHEALGHGLATLAVGDKAVFLCTCYFDSTGYYSKWIPAAGGLMNLAVGFGSLAALRLSSRLFSRMTSLLRYFLVLVAAFNLFFAFGYPAYSGLARFGDWAAVTSGLTPPWLWRVVLIMVSVVGYYGSMTLLGGPIAPFAGCASSSGFSRARFHKITLIPYISAMILACMAGALNPRGWITMLTSGLPAAAAAFGLTQVDHFIAQGSSRPPEEYMPPMERSLPWITAAIVVMILFVGVLGPGIHFQ